MGCTDALGGDRPEQQGRAGASVASVAGSIICFPPNTIFNERYIHIGDGTMIGPQITLSAGMVPGQQCLSDPVVRIGDRCLIGKGSGIVGHLSIEIGDDVWTGHHVYITDQNHGYEDLDAADLPADDARAAGRRSATARGSATARSCCPGARIGRHVIVGANSVVTGDLPDYCVAVGMPGEGDPPVRRGRRVGQPPAPELIRRHARPNQIDHGEVGQQVGDRTAVDDCFAVRRRCRRPETVRRSPDGRR